MSAIRRWLWLADAILLIVLSLYIFAGRDLVPFHGDESALIWMSADYHYLVQEHDPAPVVFRMPPVNGTRQFNRVMTGSVDALTIGLAWDLAGLTVDDLNEVWDWGAFDYPTPYEWVVNERRGAVPDDHLLAIGRTPSTLFTIASLFLVFWIARWVSRNRPATWLAAILYATSPAVLVNGRRAMQEGAMFFGTALIILVALYTLRAQRQGSWRPALLGWYLALGAASGFAMGCKHTSAIVAAIAFLVVLLYPRLARWDRTVIAFDRRHVSALLAAGVLAAIVFVALMPIWWSLAALIVLAGLLLACLSFSGLGRPWLAWAARGAAVLLIFGATELQPTVIYDILRTPFYMLEQRQQLVEIQRDEHGDIDSFGDGLVLLARDTFVSYAQYYEDPTWATFEVTKAEIVAYEASGLAGRRGWVWDALQVGLLGVGLIALAVRWREGESWLLGLWLLFPALVLLLTNPLPWQRYYIGLHAPAAILAGLGLAALLAYTGRARGGAAR